MAVGSDRMTYLTDKDYKKIVKEILRNENFKRTYFIEHHGISRSEHLLKVSYSSYRIAKVIGLDYISVARGALLHDFYLDGDERTSKRKFLDTFTHPSKALDTSMENFKLNKLEKNIIISHMFPLYPSLPKYVESLLVNMIDKIIGSHEMLREYRCKFKYQFNYLFVFLVTFITK